MNRELFDGEKSQCRMHVADEYHHRQTSFLILADLLLLLKEREMARRRRKRRRKIGRMDGWVGGW